MATAPAMLEDDEVEKIRALDKEVSKLERAFERANKEKAEAEAKTFVDRKR